MASSSIQETTGFEIQTRDMGKPHHPLPPPQAPPSSSPRQGVITTPPPASLW